MVVALGADPAATPGLVEVDREFYTVDGAFASRDVLDSFGGGRLIVGVTPTPFKCPPAPSETALMLHDYLVERGRGASQTALVMPLGVPIPPSPAASQALRESATSSSVTTGSPASKSRSSADSARTDSSTKIPQRDRRAPGR